MINWSESTIILAIVGMIGILSSLIVLLRANHLNKKYWGD